MVVVFMLQWGTAEYTDFNFKLQILNSFINGDGAINIKTFRSHISNVKVQRCLRLKFWFSSKKENELFLKLKFRVKI